MTTLQAIPTVYRGIQLRSRLEANVAFFLDELGLAWEYEPISFMLDDGTHYRPDFWIPEQRLWVECRGYTTPEGQWQKVQDRAVEQTAMARVMAEARLAQGDKATV